MNETPSCIETSFAPRAFTAQGATDSIHGRVALSDIAKHFLLPSIDIGLQTEGRDMRISNQTADFTVYNPESPCAFCYGLIDTTEMATEFMSEEERTTRLAAAQDAAVRGDDPDHYWRGIRQSQTVGYLTTMVGSLAAGNIEGWLTGAFMISLSVHFSLTSEVRA